MNGGVFEKTFLLRDLFRVIFLNFNVEYGSSSVFM